MRSVVANIFLLVKGKRGSKGETGRNGLAGEQGRTGPPGEKGRTGYQGMKVFFSFMNLTFVLFR